MTEHMSTIRRYFDAIEAGDTDAAMAHYAPGIQQIEHPNALKPKGDRRGIAELAADADRGRAMFARQRYIVKSAIEQEDRIGVQVEWEGVFAGPMGTQKQGDRMRVASAMFFRFEGGRIVEQENYDCLIAANAAPATATS